MHATVAVLMVACAVAAQGFETVPANVPIASSVDQIVQELGAQSSVQLAVASSPFDFSTPGQSMVIPPLSNVSVYCGGATIRACASCALIDARAGSSLSMFDCIVDLQSVQTQNTLSPDPGPAQNATTFNLITGLGTMSGNASVLLAQGALVLSCQTLTTISQLNGANFAPYGARNYTQVTPINATARLTSYSAPIGFSGGLYKMDNVTVMCNNDTTSLSPAPRLAAPLLLALALLALLCA